jgi:hypothetical protein
MLLGKHLACPKHKCEQREFDSPLGPKTIFFPGIMFFFGNKKALPHTSVQYMELTTVVPTWVTCEGASSSAPSAPGAFLALLPGQDELKDDKEDIVVVLLDIWSGKHQHRLALFSSIIEDNTFEAEIGGHDHAGTFKVICAADTILLPAKSTDDKPLLSHDPPLDYSHWTCCRQTRFADTCIEISTLRPCFNTCCVTSVTWRARTYWLFGDKSFLDRDPNCTSCLKAAPGGVCFVTVGGSALCFECAKAHGTVPVSYTGPLHEQHESLLLCQPGSTGTQTQSNSWENWENWECSSCGQWRNARAFGFVCQTCQPRGDKFLICVECASGHTGAFVESGLCRFDNFDQGLAICRHEDMAFKNAARNLPDQDPNGGFGVGITSRLPHWSCCGATFLVPSCATARRVKQQQFITANYELALLWNQIDEQMLMATPTSLHQRATTTWLELGINLAELRQQLALHDELGSSSFNVTLFAASIYDEDSFRREFRKVMELAAPFVRFEAQFEKIKARFT